MVGFRKLLSSSVHHLCSVQQLKTEANWEVLFFHTQKVKQGSYNTHGYNMQDESTPVMMMEQQVLDLHEKRVNYIQLKYMCIRIGYHCLAQGYYLKYYSLLLHKN